MTKKVHIIVNPASGQPQPVLHILNSVFHPAGVNWEVFITKESGDAKRYAQAAVEAGVDVVAANGGDGTVMEVAHGVKGTQVPMAILPGGTANLVSVELGIPKDLREATEVIINEDSQVRKVDMGKIGDEYFLLRIGMGIAAEKVKIADRDMKDRFGMAAYTIAGVQAIIGSQVAHYKLTMDGQEIEADGVTCIIDNAGNMGISDLKAARDIDMSDGLLDVILVHDRGAKAMAAVAASVAGRSPDPSKTQHWQARCITIETDPPLDLQVDGEMRGQTPITVEVVPAVVGVLTPG
jgi:YegS/Rv2252/BmrU family lipid kinase